MAISDDDDQPLSKAAKLSDDEKKEAVDSASDSSDDLAAMASVHAIKNVRGRAPVGDAAPVAVLNGTRIDVEFTSQFAVPLLPLYVAYPGNGFIPASPETGTSLSSLSQDKLLVPFGASCWSANGMVDLYVSFSIHLDTVQPPIPLLCNDVWSIINSYAPAKISIEKKRLWDFQNERYNRLVAEGKEYAGLFKPKPLPVSNPTQSYHDEEFDQLKRSTLRVSDVYVRAVSVCYNGNEGRSVSQVGGIYCQDYWREISRRVHPGVPLANLDHGIPMQVFRPLAQVDWYDPVKRCAGVRVDCMEQPPFYFQCVVEF
jgi:hypothetical protein